MIELKRILAPVDDTPFDEICSFETENYIGVFVDPFPIAYTSGYIIMPKSDSEFSLAFVDEANTLEQLDEIVFHKIEEHITSVSTSRCLDIKINEDYWYVIQRNQRFIPAMDVLCRSCSNSSVL